MRHDLIELSGRWTELGLAGSCPYASPTSIELLDHQKDFQSFVMAQYLKRRLVNLLDTDGDRWVPTESWEATKVAHKEAFDELIQIVRSAESTDDLNEEDLRRI